MAHSHRWATRHSSATRRALRQGEMDWLLNDLGKLLPSASRKRTPLFARLVSPELGGARQHHHDRRGAGGRQRHRRRPCRLARAKEIRNKVIFWGIAAAVMLRIFFAAITTQLLAIVGLILAGGILLLWVCWKMYRQIASGDHHGQVDRGSGAGARRARLLAGRGPSRWPTSRCRSTTCWPSPAPPRVRPWYWSSALLWRSY